MGVTFEYFRAPDDAAAAAVAHRGPAAAGLPTATAGGVFDPTTHLAVLLTLLGGGAIGPTFGDPVALVNDGEQIVLPLAPAVAAALDGVDRDRAATVAATWADDPDFWRSPDPAVLAQFVEDLADVARGGERLYCWLSV